MPLRANLRTTTEKCDGPAQENAPALLFRSQSHPRAATAGNIDGTLTTSRRWPIISCVSWQARCGSFSPDRPCDTVLPHIEITNLDGLSKTRCECCATVRTRYNGLLRPRCVS